MNLSRKIDWVQRKNPARHRGENKNPWSKTATPKIIPFLKMEKPTAAAAALWLAGMYLLSALLMILSHGIATLIRKFGPTYGVVMALYFIMMILSGYMGIQTSKLPDFLKPVSDLLPTTQLGNDYIKFWMGKEYNFGPLVQSMLFFGALSLIVLLIAFKVRGRKR